MPTSGPRNLAHVAICLQGLSHRTTVSSEGRLVDKDTQPHAAVGSYVEDEMMCSDGDSSHAMRAMTLPSFAMLASLPNFGCKENCYSKSISHHLSYHHSITPYKAAHGASSSLSFISSNSSRVIYESSDSDLSLLLSLKICSLDVLADTIIQHRVLSAVSLQVDFPLCY